MNKKNIYFFLFNGFSDWEISYLTSELQKSKKIELLYVSIDGKNVKSMGGLTINPDLSIDKVDSSQVSVFILPGGPAWENDEIQGIDELLQKLYTLNKTIAAICGATIYLGGKSFLDNTKHTSNALFYLENFAKNYKGAINYICSCVAFILF